MADDENSKSASKSGKANSVRSTRSTRSTRSKKSSASKKSAASKKDAKSSKKGQTHLQEGNESEDSRVGDFSEEGGEEGDLPGDDGDMDELARVDSQLDQLDVNKMADEDFKMAAGGVGEEISSDGLFKQTISEFDQQLGELSKRKRLALRRIQLLKKKKAVIDQLEQTRQLEQEADRLMEEQTARMEALKNHVGDQNPSVPLTAGINNNGANPPVQPLRPTAGGGGGNGGGATGLWIPAPPNVPLNDAMAPAPVSDLQQVAERLVREKTARRRAQAPSVPPTMADLRRPPEIASCPTPGVDHLTRLGLVPPNLVHLIKEEEETPKTGLYTG